MKLFKSCIQSYDELEKHIQFLTKQNNHLQEKIEKMENTTTTLIEKDIQSFFNNINDEKINEIVEKILKNDSINFTLIPDEIEKRIYHNVIKLVLSIVKDRLD